jgi:acyl-CoA thioester hydrolase
MAKTNLINREIPNDMPEFNWQVRVYYEDTDAAGVVYHSNYLKYMERARTEWLRAAGYSQKQLVREARVAFVVANMKIDFIVPAKFDELLDVRSTITDFGGSKLAFRQSIYNQEDQLKCRADIQIVCIDPGSFKPKRIPEDIKAKLSYDN